MMLPNALGPGSSGLRLRPSRSLHLPWRWLHVWYSVHTPSFSPRARRHVVGLRGLLGWPSRRFDGVCTSEDAVPTAGCSVVVLCRLALERPGLETETSAHRWSELSTCCLAATPRMPFSYWYTLPTLSVEGADRVTKRATTTATFWLAPGKVGCGVPSWLMATVMALARARALV
jgi:hypothetical protein